MKIDTLDSARSALLVIDLQNAFCHKDGTLGRSGLDTDHLGSVIPRLRTVIEACRQADMPVIWTMQEHFEKDQRRGRKRLAPHTAKRKGIAALAGSWDAAIVDELADLADNPSLVIRKHRFGGFYETRLDMVLKMLGVEAVFITGLTTNACVETTIREAYLRDYDVVGVEDCIAGVRPAWETQAREVWNQYFAVTCDSVEFMAWLEAQRQPRTLGIHHLLLMVSDLERSKRFYIDRLGFEERLGAKPLPDGRPFISLRQGLGLTAGGPGDLKQMDHLAFEVHDVTGLNDSLKQAGVEFVRELGPGPYGLSIYIKDPDGNTLELFEA